MHQVAVWLNEHKSVLAGLWLFGVALLVLSAFGFAEQAAARPAARGDQRQRRAREATEPPHRDAQTVQLRSVRRDTTDDAPTRTLSAVGAAPHLGATEAWSPVAEIDPTGELRASYVDGAGKGRRHAVPRGTRRPAPARPAIGRARVVPMYPHARRPLGRDSVMVATDIGVVLIEDEPTLELLAADRVALDDIECRFREALYGLDWSVLDAMIPELVYS